MVLCDYLSLWKSIHVPSLDICIACNQRGHRHGAWSKVLVSTVTSNKLTKTFVNYMLTFNSAKRPCSGNFYKPYYTVHGASLTISRSLWLSHISQSKACKDKKSTLTKVNKSKRNMKRSFACVKGLKKGFRQANDFEESFPFLPQIPTPLIAPKTVASPNQSKG